MNTKVCVNGDNCISVRGGELPLTDFDLCSSGNRKSKCKKCTHNSGYGTGRPNYSQLFMGSLLWVPANQTKIINYFLKMRL